MALRELARRKGLANTDAELCVRLLADLFDKQRAFILDPAQYKDALCPRRAGKTTMVPTQHYTKLLKAPPNRITRYWGITADRAYQLMWRPMIRCAERHGIRIRPEESTQTIHLLDKGSEIRLVGADKAKEGEKKRGEATMLETVDEASLYGSYLKALVEDVIGPSLLDFRGELNLLGTPGVLFDGYWFDVSGPDADKAEEGRRIAGGYSHHRWDVYDNPFMPNAREDIEKLRLSRGWAPDHPTYLREYRGRWILDAEGLFYRFNPELNSYDGVLPPLPAGHEWEYVLGWDIGANDAMALVLWAECPDVYPDLFEAESWKKPGAPISEVAERVRELEKRVGHVPRKVADTGGGGKVTVNEMALREHIYFEPAKKTDKPGIVRFMNDAFTMGHIKVKRGSPLADEYATLLKNPDKPDEEDPACDNHCTDAGLYSYRRARHFQHQPQSETPKVGTNAYFDNIAKQMERDALARLEEEKDEPWWAQ
jgi:hypothetical protein